MLFLINDQLKTIKVINSSHVPNRCSIGVDPDVVLNTGRKVNLHNRGPMCKQTYGKVDITVVISMKVEAQSNNSQVLYCTQKAASNPSFPHELTALWC